MNLSDIAILNIKVFNYQWIISGISKNETINLKKHIHFTEKNGISSDIKIYFHT